MKNSTMCIFTAACLSLLVIPLILQCTASSSETESISFQKEETEWRENRHKRMLSSTSWLSIAGLFWLQEGENNFGTSPECRVRLRQNSAPPRAGKFILDNDRITLAAAPGVQLEIDDKPVTRIQLKGDDSEKPDIIKLQDLRMWIIKRGERYAVRLRDLNHAPYKNYKGLDFFPPTEEFKVEADFVAYPTPKKMRIETIIGTEDQMVSPGYVEFVLQGREHQLIVFGEGSKPLFIIFRDLTSGEETYGAGRFMYSSFLDNGKVDLNFNRAFNPPCAYTPYATCPLPPVENELDIRIEAGEKTYPDSHH